MLIAIQDSNNLENLWNFVQTIILPLLNNLIQLDYKEELELILFGTINISTKMFALINKQDITIKSISNTSSFVIFIEALKQNDNSHISKVEANSVVLAYKDSLNF